MGLNKLCFKFNIKCVKTYMSAKIYHFSTFLKSTGNRLSALLVVSPPPSHHGGVTGLLPPHPRVLVPPWPKALLGQGPSGVH